MNIFKALLFNIIVSVFIVLCLSNSNLIFATSSVQHEPSKLVHELENGIKYRVLKKGTGLTSPKLFNKVTTHYEGRLLDGTVFDSSYARNQAATFGLRQVIPGWTSTLQKMVKGDKWEVTIPAHLAYGNRAAGPIPPNSTLVFIIELLDIL